MRVCIINHCCNLAYCYLHWREPHHFKELLKEASCVLWCEAVSAEAFNYILNLVEAIVVAR